MFAVGKTSQHEIKSIGISRTLQQGEMLNAEPALPAIRFALSGAKFHANFCVMGVFGPKPALFLEYPEHLPERNWCHSHPVEFSLANAVLSQADRLL
jgi:hypothetical protein